MVVYEKLLLNHVVFSTLTSRYRILKTSKREVLTKSFLCARRKTHKICWNGSFRCSLNNRLERTTFKEKFTVIVNSCTDMLWLFMINVSLKVIIILFRIRGEVSLDFWSTNPKKRVQFEGRRQWDLNEISWENLTLFALIECPKQ